MNENAYEKKQHLVKAELLLAAGDTQSLRYAALEMRYFLEAHVYERLFAEIDNLPSNIINTWQPNKAMKIFSMFDERADMDYRLNVQDATTGEGVELRYYNIKNSELNKSYNSLGSFLHLPQPGKQKDYKVDGEKLKNIFDTIKPLADGNLIVVRQHIDDFNCEKCGKPILYTHHYVKNHDSIFCQNEQCGNEHLIMHEPDKVSFGSTAKLPCKKCHAEMTVFPMAFKSGDVVSCKNCQLEYIVRFYLASEEPDDAATEGMSAAQS